MREKAVFSAKIVSGLVLTGILTVWHLGLSSFYYTWAEAQGLTQQAYPAVVFAGYGINILAGMLISALLIRRLKQ